MLSMLRDAGHDVLSVSEIYPTASDSDLITLALQERRVLITEDKDFGELIFVRRMPHPCIVRLVEMPVSDKLDAMRTLVENHSQSMHEGTLIVATPNRVRIRSSEL